MSFIDLNLASFAPLAVAFTPTHLWGALTWGLAALVGYISLTVIYNLYFHPLRNFPGPLLYRASNIPRALRVLNGTWTREMLGISEKYGPVVRITPNSLVYTTSEAWKDIYSHQNGAVVKGEEFDKDSGFYRNRGVPLSILSETRDNHALLRRQVSHGFSEKILRDQEPIIKGYVDLMMNRLRDRCILPNPADEEKKGAAPSGPSRGVFDMRDWFSYVTFDIIGDMAMGEPFGCLEKGELDDRVAFIENGLKAASMIFFLKEIGLERLTTWLSMTVAKSRKNIVEKTSSVLRRRMNLNMERPDLIEGLLKKNDEWNIGFERLRSTATLLIVAGSETTATLLTGTIYLLMKNPSCWEKVKQEIRSSFKSEDEITFSSVENLPYMLACLKETLRHYPPVAGNMPRTVPKGGAHIAGTFVPEGTSVGISQWSINHSTRNFSDPWSYKPERFLQPDQFKDDDFEALQPFSSGPRNCVGKNLAYAEMRIILARCIYNFDMELVDPSNDWLNHEAFFLWRKPPLNMYLTPVKR